MNGLAPVARLRVPAVAAWAPWLVLTGGGLLRLERYVGNRSFWLDESMLGLNLIEKSVHGLLGSLEYVQSAPVGFLLAEKASIGLFGESERSLRLVPFLASLAGLVLFVLVARRLLRPWPALLALTLFAANEPLLYQSSEAKPYSSDLAVSLLLLWLTLRALDAVAGGVTLRAALPLAVVGTGAVWFSYPAVFVLAGGLAALLVRAGRDRLRRSLAILLPVGAVLGASFLAVYLVSSRSIAAVRSSVFAGDPHAASRFGGLARLGWVSLADPGGFLPSMRSVAVLCLVAGLVALAARDRVDRLVLLALPGVLAIAAAVLDKYPLGGRFSLFLVPFLLVLVARGAEELVAVSRRPALLGLPLALLLAAPPLGQALDHVAAPPVREQVRPLLQLLDREWRPGDTLYVYRNAQYALRFYGECRGCGVPRLPFRLRSGRPGVEDAGTQAALASVPPSVLVGESHSSPVGILRELDELRGRSRVWLLFSHVSGAGGGLDEESLSLAYLDDIGHRLRSWSETGAALYLYDLRR